MRISAFTQRTGVSRDTVRFYERRGLLRPAVAANGYRDYSELDVERVALIRIGQRLGFTLREIGPLARAWEQDALGPSEQRRVITRRLGEIDARIAEMQAIRTYLVAKLDWLEQGGTGPRPVLGATGKDPAPVPSLAAVGTRKPGLRQPRMDRMVGRDRKRSQRR